MRTYVKYLITTILLTVAIGKSNAAIEKFLQTKKGTTIAAGLVQTISDPNFGALLAGGGTLPGQFVINSNEVGFKLYFDDALRTKYSNWSIQVIYKVDVYSAGGAHSFYPAETLTISYNTSGDYTDMQIKKYIGNKARFEIVSVTKTGLSTVPNDVYIDFTCEVDRTYKISTTIVPQICGSLDPTLQTFKFAWPHLSGIEWYELEYLFIDYGTLSFGTNLPIDFKNATRINLSDQTYTINMIYPRGRLLYRVRGVGFSTTVPGMKEYTPWSYDPSPGTTTPPSNVTILGTSYAQYLNYNGFESNISWSYASVFTEEGKRTDNISFMDDLMRERQAITMNQEENRPILSQTIYDFVGRPAIQVLPSPIKWNSNTGLKYYNDLTMTDHTGGTVVVDYDYHYFDTDSKTVNPDDIRASGSLGAGYHYSSLNTTDPTVNGKYIPDAEGYPYIRTQFLNDGTNRVKSQSGVGDEFKSNSTHEVKMLYGSPGSQQEIDRLFGNEAGIVTMYSKEALVDENGQTSIKYMDNEGRVVATALSGAAPTNLRAINSMPTSFPTITSNLHDYNHLSSDNQWIVNQSFIVATTGDYNFSYEMNGDTVCNDCIDYDAGTPVVHCADCYYDLEVKIVNNDDGAVKYSNSFYNIQDKSPALTFTVNLTPGSYNVYKNLKLNTGFVNTNVDSFETKQSCVELIIPDGGDCAPSCTTMCEQQHSYIDPSTGNTVWFTQNNDATHTITVVAIKTPLGSFVSGNQTAIDNIINPCISSCAATASPSDIYPCEFKMNVLKIDMSPGGQYFDNLPDFFNGGGYNINGWFTANSIPIPTQITTACSTCTTWSLVRSNWVDAWADYTVLLHPEYCAWERECQCQGASYSTIKTFLETFESASPAFYSSGTTINTSATFFDPTRIASSTAGGPTGAPLYQPFNLPSTSDVQFDKFLLCLDTSYLGPLNRMLLRFIPNHPTSHTSYYSIWYLLRDPDGIAYDNGDNYNGTVHADIQAVFDYMHGNASASPVIPGLIGTGTNQISEAEFFRRSYLLFRQKTVYDYANACSSLYLSDTDGDGKDASGFDIRYPTNALFENWPWPFLSGTMADLETDIMDPEIASMCQPNVDTWMDAVVAACGTTIPAGTLTAMEGHLLDICTGSDPENFYYSYNVLETGFITVNSVNCSTFVQVIQSYQSTYGCLSSVVYPVVPTAYGQGTCACEGFVDFLTANSLSLSSSSASIVSAINASDLLSGTETVNTTQIGVWVSQCNSATPNYTTLTSNGLIKTFQCPSNLDNTQTASQWVIDCNAALDALAAFNATNSYENELNALVNSYEAQVKTSCMDTGATKLKERFTMSYTLPEYHYTLYFYDQAGNLVKTVSPEGVNRIINGTSSFTSLLSGTTLHDVEDHRDNPTVDPFIHPAHALKTGYKYNSLNQLTERSTADEGKSTYFYDYLGRLVVSQNAKQIASNQYSVVRYDELSREIEAYIITNSTALTQPVASTVGTSSGSLEFWIAGGTNKIELTKIFYDEVMDVSIATLISPVVQSNLRNRISSVSYTQTASAPIGSLYDYATHYSYDIHGNVKTVVQDNQALARYGQNIKRIEYEYELISGNVSKLSYQPGKYDQYYHQYYYDKNNQLEEVYTSKDGLLWERDADYFYQTMGQLSRHEQGQRAVNGVDYAYTVQGWLKGVNSNSIDKSRDIGKDGNFTASAATDRINQHYALDAYGYTIGYYQDDYRNVGGVTAANMFEASTAGNTLFTKTKSNLYNGNIGHIVTSQVTTNNTSATRRTLGKAYEYDQLNRLMEMETNQAIDVTGNDWDTYVATNAYKEYGIVYDGNGNIVNFKRGGLSLGMDDLGYNYNLGGSGALTNNYLTFVTDAVSTCNYLTDIDNQTNSNYGYNQIGQLIKDNHEYISDIFWYNRGKVKKIIKDKAVNTKCSTEVANNDMEYLYDAMGHKICKIDKPHKGSGAGIENQSKYKYTWYVNDAMGNVLSTYEQTFAPATGNNFNSTITQVEVNIMGLGREGMAMPEGRSITQLMSFSSSSQFLTTQTETLAGGGAYNEDLFKWSVLTSIAAPSLNFNYTNYVQEREAGNKLFELNSHLGSALTVTLDRKLQYDDGTPDGIVDRYYPELVSWSDYYSFGSVLEVGVLGSTDYRYGYQGSEKEIQATTGGAYSTEYRMLDTRIGRWFSPDPIEQPWQAPYTSMDNNPVALNDVLGLQAKGDDKNTGWKSGHGVVCPGGVFGAEGSTCQHGHKGSHTIEKHRKLRKFAQKAANFFAEFGKSNGQYLINSYKKNKGNDVLRQGPSSFIVKEERLNLLEQRLKNCVSLFEQQQIQAIIENRRTTIVQGGVKQQSNPTIAPWDQQFHDGGIGLVVDDIVGTWIFKGGGKLYTLLKESGIGSSVFKASKRVLPNSGPIMRSIGAASKAEMLAKKFRMNINSPTTRQVLNSLDQSVESFISTYRKSSIRSEIPGEFLGQSVEQALKSGNTTIRKLLTDGRFVK